MFQLGWDILQEKQINALLRDLFAKYHKNMIEKMKDSDFIFKHVNRLYYECIKYEWFMHWFFKLKTKNQVLIFKTKILNISNMK